MLRLGRVGVADGGDVFEAFGFEESTAVSAKPHYQPLIGRHR
jgi:hypothetical protein